MRDGSRLGLRRARTDPEEVVRRALEAHLLGDLGIPRPCLRRELSLAAWDGAVRDRVDLVAFAVEAAGPRPVLLCECKAPDVPLDEAVEAQVRRYLRLLPAPWVVIANGPQMRSYRIEEGIWRSAPLPPWSEMRLSGA